MALAFAMLGICSTGAAAQAVFEDYQWYVVESAGEYDVVIADDVDDGCWTDPSRSSTKAALQLIRSGYEANELSPEEASGITPMLLLSAVGYETGDFSCVVSAQVTVRVFDWGQVGEDPHAVTTFFNRDLWDTTFLLSGPKANMSERVSNAHEQLVEEYLVKLATKRIEFEKSTLESLKDDPEGHSHWTEKFAE